VGLNKNDLKLVLAEMYENTFKIYNHHVDDRNKPMATVSFHSKEDYTSGGPTENSMNNYIDCEIHKYFGLNYTQFMSYPRHDVEVMMNIAKDRQKKQGVAMSGVDKDLRAMQRDLQA
jgi:hypothetical protein